MFILIFSLKITAISPGCTSIPLSILRNDPFNIEGLSEAIESNVQW